MDAVTRLNLIDGCSEMFNFIGGYWKILNLIDECTEILNLIGGVLGNVKSYWWII